MAGVLGRIAAGVAAGAAGALAMDLVWYTRYRDGGGDEGFVDWEFATSTASFEEAGAPGQVADRLAGAVGIDLPDEQAGLATNVMHWVTGCGYGVGHALLNADRGVVSGGVLTGAGAFATSYATLGALGVYEPAWEYDRETLAKDLSAHIVYGLAASAVFRLLRR